MEQVIVRDGETGQAIVSGANVPVAAILERLAVWGSVERVLAAFPALTREGFEAAIRFAAISVDREVRYDQSEDVDHLEFREPASAYYARVAPADAAAEAEAVFEDARYDYHLADALRRGFGDLTAGRVMPNAEFMAELRAMIQA